MKKLYLLTILLLFCACKEEHKLIELPPCKDSCVEYCEEGLATYYAYNSTRFTANGDKFNEDSLTCAYYLDCDNRNHLLNKKVKVTNLRNGKSIVCLISDCGIFKQPEYAHLNHIIDLTPKAFETLGCFNAKERRKLGVLYVKVELLN